MKKLISALSSLCLAVTSLSGAFPALHAENVITANAADKIVYNLVPHDKDYKSAKDNGTANNSYTATAGESLTVDWIVTGDQGTAGIQMNFDFTQVTLVDSEKGNAYRVSPTFSDYKTAKDLKEGECVYTWAQSSALKASDGSVIYSFNIKVPSADGVYTVGLSKNGKDTNKVVPVDENSPYDFDFYGLAITVGNPTTTPAPSTTPSTTPAPGTPAQVSADTIIYNLIPSGKTYKSAQENGLKNNVYTATAGEELTVDWTIKNDQGTAGIQMNFDFTQVKVTDSEKGSAYRVSPTFSDHTTAKS
ncbi:MAG: hypothetical protein IKX57_05715, partial [Oscillospiraceae bacterium]|nr:hypothetical protein [Oscillospiraceae bacterium]